MSDAHTRQSLTKLRSIGEGEGGRVAVVVGAEGLHYAGCRRPPARTPLECVLTFLAPCPYTEIVVATTGGNHLPDIPIATRTALRSWTGIWRFRGKEDGTAGRDDSTARSGAADRREHDLDLGSLMSDVGIRSTPDRIIWTPPRDGNTLPDRLRELLAVVEERCGLEWNLSHHDPIPHGATSRTLVLVDDAFLMPDRFRLEQEIPEHRERGMLEDRFSKLPGLCESTPVDVVILTREKETVERLATGGFVCAGLEDRRLPPDLVEQLPDLRLEHCIPVLLKPLSVQEPHGPLFAKSASDSTLYAAMREIPPSLRRTGQVESDEMRGFPLEEYVAPSQVWNYIHRVRHMMLRREEVMDRIHERKQRLFGETEKARLETLKTYENSFKRCSALVYGPPGTGKTTLAQSLMTALEGRISIEVVEAAALSTGGLQDVSLDKLDALYRGWKEKEQLIVYFNEADEYLSKRNENMAGLVNAFKTIFEPPSGRIDTNIIYIADTNDPERIDAAIKERFRSHLYIGLPSRRGRLAIIHGCLRKLGGDVQLVGGLDEDRLADLMAGQSARRMVKVFFGKLEDDLLYNDTLEIDEAYVRRWMRRNPQDDNTRNLVAKFADEQETFEEDCEALLSRTDARPPIDLDQPPKVGLTP